MNENNIRSFFGIELTEHDRARIAELTTPLKQYQSIRWLPTVSLHITLCFLNEISLSLVPKLIEHAQSYLANSQEFRINLTRLEYFPSNRPKVIALLPDSTEILTRLANKINEAALACGLRLEDKPFRPHLSLARVKNPRDQSIILPPDVALKNIEIRKVSLFKSLGHSYYQSLASFALATE